MGSTRRDRTKRPKAKTHKRLNIWFCSPCCEVPLRKNENPMKRPCTKKAERQPLRSNSTRPLSADTYRKNTEDNLGVNVRGGAPVLLEHATKDDAELNAKGSGKLGVRCSLLRRLLGGLELILLGLGRSTLGFETMKLVLDCDTLSRIQPRLVPVDVAMGAGSRANDLRGRVSLGSAVA